MNVITLLNRIVACYACISMVVVLWDFSDSPDGSTLITITLSLLAWMWSGFVAINEIKNYSWRKRHEE